MRYPIFAVVASVSFSLSAIVSLAEDMRIETRIFDDKHEEPIARNLTLFSNGAVYDFRQAEPPEISVYVPQRGHFILLDVGRRVQTRIPMDVLVKFTSAMQVVANVGSPVNRFAAYPKFAVRASRSKNEIVMDSPVMTYRVQGTKADTAETVRLYRQFADGYAHLNATVPGSRPPFARLALNEKLAEQQLIPIEVEFTLRTNRSGAAQTITSRSQHEIAWGLRETDQEQIEQVGEYLVRFADVSFGQYRGLNQEAARK